MTASEAYNVLTKKHPNRTALNCTEYSDRFVFVTIFKGTKINKDDMILDSSLSVDKKTSEITAFQPFDIPIEEYRKGKPIKDFK